MNKPGRLWKIALTFVLVLFLFGLGAWEIGLAQALRLPFAELTARSEINPSNGAVAFAAKDPTLIKDNSPWNSSVPMQSSLAPSSVTAGDSSWQRGLSVVSILGWGAVIIILVLTGVNSYRQRHPYRS